jgi:hypothetical protein
MTATPLTDAAWSHLWHRVGHHRFCSPTTCSAAGSPHPGFDEAMEWAIDQLSDAGYRPDGADADAVSSAQSHLALAALHCPAIVQ